MPQMADFGNEPLSQLAGVLLDRVSGAFHNPKVQRLAVRNRILPLSSQNA